MSPPVVAVILLVVAERNGNSTCSLPSWHALYLTAYLVDHPVCLKRWLSCLEHAILGFAVLLTLL